jgi:hypothetical protein
MMLRRFRTSSVLVTVVTLLPTTWRMSYLLLDPMRSGTNLSKSRRTSVCTNLKTIMKYSTIANDLLYASSSRVYHTRQEKRAHQICAQEAKRQWKDLEHCSLKQRKKKHDSTPFLEEFNSKVLAEVAKQFFSKKHCRIVG